MDVKYSSKMAEALRYQTLEDFLFSHQFPRTLLFEHEAGKRSSDKTYEECAHFWGDVIDEHLRAPEVVRLKDFRVFEWVSRNPGLYHTPEAAWKREDALRHIAEVRGKPEVFMETLEALPDHASGDVTGKLTLGKKADRIEVFNPYGKLSMLEGGVGCVRLRPVYLSGDLAKEYFVLSASSSLYADEGLPILVSSEQAQILMSDIKAHGYSLRSEIVGRTRYVPKELSDVFSSRNGIPRLYVEVESIGDSRPRDKRCYVSVAASFIGEFDRRKGIYATYVTFDPGWRGARNGAAKWLSDEYAAGLYGGYLVTDFDEIAPQISDTLFSLDRVRSDGSLKELIDEIEAVHGHFRWELLEEKRITFERTVNKYEIRQNVTAGPNSSITQIGRDNR